MSPLSSPFEFSPLNSLVGRQLIGQPGLLSTERFFRLALRPPVIDGEMAHGGFDEIAQASRLRIGIRELACKKAHREFVGEFLRRRRLLCHRQQIAVNRAVIAWVITCTGICRRWWS